MYIYIYICGVVLPTSPHASPMVSPPHTPTF